MRGKHIVLPTYFVNMFELKGNLQFVNIDTEYVRKLHEACPEVYYKSKDYDKKPYIGILLSKNGYNYVVPMTSAKEKHKTWKNTYSDRLLVYEIVDYKDLASDDIWVKIDDSNNVKHIISAVDIKKMIPVKDEVISFVNINYENDDDLDQKKYKDLLNKEYKFCIGIIDDVVKKASRIYEKQIISGKIIPYACDYKKLEEVADEYMK